MNGPTNTGPVTWSFGHGCEMAGGITQQGLDTHTLIDTKFGQLPELVSTTAYQ